MHGRRLVDLHAQIGERDARPQRIAVERRRVERQGPVRLGRCQPFGMAVVQHCVVEGADLARGVVGLDGLHEVVGVDPELTRQCRQVVRLLAGEHRRHEPAYRLGIDDRIGDLVRLEGDQPAPDGIALGPEVFAFVIEAPAIAIDDDAQRHAVDPGADAAVIERRARIDRHRMALRRVADLVRARFEHLLEQHAGVEAGAADDEVVRHPLAFVLSPGLAQPFAVRFEAAIGNHAGLGLDAFVTHISGAELAIDQFQPVDRGVVADLHAQVLRAAEVGIDQRLAAAQEERVGARQVQGAGQRILEAHAVLDHPRPAGRRVADRQPGELLVGDAAGDLQQVLPVLFFRIGLGQHVLRLVVHAAQVARVDRVAAAPFLRRGLEQQHAGTGFARHQGGAQGSVAAADHEHIDHIRVSP